MILFVDEMSLYTGCSLIVWKVAISCCICARPAQSGPMRLLGSFWSIPVNVLSYGDPIVKSRMIP